VQQKTVDELNEQTAELNETLSETMRSSMDSERRGQLREVREQVVGEMEARIELARREREAVEFGHAEVVGEFRA
jgi:hypothetical protein